MECTIRFFLFNFEVKLNSINIDDNAELILDGRKLNSLLFLTSYIFNFFLKNFFASYFEREETKCILIFLLKLFIKFFIFSSTPPLSKEG